MQGQNHEHQVSERAAFLSNGLHPRPLALFECVGCRQQPWQVRERDGQIVRFYSPERGDALARRIANSRTKIIALALGG